jgi:WD40 repeat protein
VRIWDAETGKELQVFEPDNGPIIGGAFSSDGGHVLVTAGPQAGEDRKKKWYCHRWVTETGKSTGGFMKGDTSPPSLATQIAPFPDGDRVVEAQAVNAAGFQVGCYFQVLSMERAGKELNEFVQTKAPLTVWTFARDGQKALSGGGEGRESSLWLWDLKTAKTRLVGSPGAGVLALALSADGRRALSSGADGLIHLWDVDGSKEVRRLQGHTGAVASLAFSPDGRRALSGGHDKTVRLWDVETGKELRRLQGHTDQVLGVAFSSDGRRAVSGSADKTVRVWRLPQ